jgi:Hg(II)-responsive transcriptional regulator
MDTNGRTIGKLARDAGIHVETIRYYEQRGLLKQPRRSQGWRRYDDEALRVLRFVKRAQELGFSLDEVHELLSLRASKSPRTCARVRAAAESKLADVEAKIRDLEAIRGELSELARTCPSDGPPETCPILGALDRKGGSCDT